MTIYPKPSSWITLFIASSPIWLFSIYCAVDKAFIEAFVSLLFAGFIILYNFSLRLSFQDGFLKLRRYGILVWSVRCGDLKIKHGRGGDFSFIPAYIVSSDNEHFEEYILKSWFLEDEIREMFVAAKIIFD